MMGKNVLKSVEMQPHPKNVVKLEGKRVGTNVLGNLEIHARVIPIPSFIIEAGGIEDFIILAQRENLFQQPHIISLPAYQWESLSQSIQLTADEGLYRGSLSLLSRNHILNYEPPEYYRYTMPQKLVTHALRRDRSKAYKFYKALLIENDKKEALGHLPSFEREFINKQWDLLRWQKYDERKRAKSKSLKKIKKIPQKPDTYEDVESAWNTVDQSYLEHVVTGLLESINMGWSSSFIPSVRTLKGGSEKYIRDQVIAQNKAVEYIWRVRLRGHMFSSGRPWFHLSLDKSIFESVGETTPQDIVDVLNTALNPQAHCGICITMTGWQDAWRVGKPRNRLEEFIREISDIGTINNLPVYGARSKWVGIDLLDQGLTFAGTLLNGGERIHSKGVVDRNSPKAFGKTPIYGECIEVFISDIFEIGKDVGEFQGPIPLHKFPGVDNICDPTLQLDDKLYRMSFGKPRRIATHTQELIDIRSALKNGVFNPGREYIKRSNLWKGAKQ